jgi:hypothetical protein
MLKQQQEGFSTRVLKKIDLFGTEPKIKIQSNEKYNTAFGGIVSIFFCIAALMGFIYFGQELIIRANPSVIVTNQYDADPDRFNLTSDKFNYIFAIEDQNSNYYYDPTIFGIRARLNVYTAQTDEKGQPVIIYDHYYLRVELCNIDRHFPHFREQFAPLLVNSMMCIHPDDNPLLRIQGIFGSPVYTDLAVQVLSCVNGTLPNVFKSDVCAPQSVIDAKLAGGYFGAYVIDTIFDPTNYTHPETYVARNYYTTISKNFYKRFEIYFKNIDYITDSGLLLEDKQPKRYLMLDRTYEAFDFRTNSDNFFAFVLRMSNNRDIYTRKYVKVQEILANMGGLIKGIILAVQILFFLFQRANYYFFLIEKLYTVYGVTKFGREVGVAIQLPNISSSKIDSGLINNFISENKTMSLYENNLMAKKMRDLAYERKKVISLSGIISVPFMLCCGRKNRSVNIYQCGKAKIDANTDFIRLYNLTEELELIKTIMFPEERSRTLIDFLIENKVLSTNSGHEKTSVDEVINNYKNLLPEGLNNSLKSVFETKLNILLKNTSTLG